MRLFRCLVGVLAILSFFGPAAAAQAKPPAAEPIAALQGALRPGDLLRIRVWPNEELGGEFPIEETGLVLLPIVGDVRAAGRPLAELRAELGERYGAALKSPVIGITPVFSVSILGAVQRPGLYQVTPTHSLFDLISLAGGLREDADDEKITLLRSGEATRIDVRAALSGDGPAELAMLRSGDRVVVEKQRRFNFQTVLYVLQSATFVATVVSLLGK